MLHSREKNRFASQERQRGRSGRWLQIAIANLSVTDWCSVLWKEPPRLNSANKWNWQLSSTSADTGRASWKSQGTELGICRSHAMWATSGVCIKRAVHPPVHSCTRAVLEAGMNSSVGGIATCLLATTCHLFIYYPISLCEWFWRLQRLHHIRKTMISSISLPPINHMVSHTQSWLSLYHPMDCSTPDSFVHRILPARNLEWVAIPFSRGSSQPTNWTRVSCIAGGFFTV